MNPKLLQTSCVKCCYWLFLPHEVGSATTMNTCTFLHQYGEELMLCFQCWCLNVENICLNPGSSQNNNLPTGLISFTWIMTMFTNVQTCLWTLSSVQVTLIFRALGETQLGCWKNLKDVSVGRKASVFSLDHKNHMRISPLDSSKVGTYWMASPLQRSVYFFTINSLVHYFMDGLM